MNESNYKFNNMKTTSYVFPNNLVSKNNYNNTNCTENLYLKGEDVFEYNTNKLKPMYNYTSPPIYNEHVYNHPNTIRTKVSKNSNNVGFPKNSSCLNSFPCLSSKCKKVEPNNIGKHNNNKYLVQKAHKPLYYIQNGQVVSHNSCENIYNDASIVSQNYKQPIYYKHSIQPKSIEHIPNLTYQNNENEMKYIYEPFKKRVTKENIHDITKQNKLDELIKVKDEHIKELEKGVEREIALNEINNTLENKKLKERLLDQKIKYKETLKHLKKVENEKRTLKTSLNARDKVLTKLEKEIGSVDDENEFLQKVKDNTDLNEIHNVFKYLHGDDNEILKKNINKNKGLKYLDGDELEKTNYKLYKSKVDENIASENDDLSNDERTIYNNKKKVNRIGKKNILDKNDVYLLKSTVVELEREINILKVENKDINFKYENTFKTLSELRKDALEYMESIFSRDKRIAYMETMLQKCERDLLKLRENFKKQKLIYEEKIDKLTSEVTILEQQSSHLQCMIQEKDAQIVLLKSEIIRNETLIKQYEERNKELQDELRLMCNNLESVIEASNKKDLFMNELEKQIRENEVHRQNAYLKEVAKNRKTHTDMKFKEVLYDKASKHTSDQLNHLKKELYLNKIQVKKAKDAFEILRNKPQAECLIQENLDYDYSTANFSEYKNEKNPENILNGTNISTDIYTEYKVNNSVHKKNSKKNEIY